MDAEWSDANKRNMERFLDWMYADNLSLGRIDRYLNSFVKLAPHIDFDLTEPQERELRQIVAGINQSRIVEYQMAPATRVEFKSALRKFYKLYTGQDEPECLSWMSIHIKKNEKRNIDLARLPQGKHARCMAKQAPNRRDAALIGLLWDSGARISEALALTWRDIDRFCRDDWEVSVTGKTGERKIPLYESINLLRKWRSDHPDPSPQNYVFSQLKCPSQISHRRVLDQLRSAKLDADVPVRIEVNPQRWRQGRACFLARQPEYNAFYLCSHFGWERLKTALFYVKLAHNDVKEAFRKVHERKGTDMLDEDASGESEQVEMITIQA